jgi:hypothetical protein
MKNQQLFSHIPIYLATLLLLFVWGCERSVSGLEEAPNSDNPDVFIDTFSSGLNYAAFEGSVPEAFTVVDDETYDNTEASMRFVVPDVGDPRGSYAGGAFFTSAPRDLTGYNALTFYAKASESTQIGVLGLGLDLGENQYEASVQNTRVTRTWQQYIIPVPDPSLLDAEQGLFFYSSGPINEEGYTFWIDEVKFENLGSIAFDGSVILNGEEREVNGQNGQTFTIDGLASQHRLPDGTLGEVTPSPFYFNFSSSDESVAQVGDDGTVTVTGEGTAVITATLQGNTAEGSLTVNSTGEATTPSVSAPVPTVSEENVISLFSDEYTDVPVDTWRAGFSVAELEDIEIEGNPTKKYTSLDFVGIETLGPNLVDASDMDFFNIDVWTPNMDVVRIKLVDFGANGEFDGGDDSEFELVFDNLSKEQWNTLRIPLSDFTGLQNRSNIAQLILSGLPTGSSTLYVDNVYFSSEDGGSQTDEPVNAAPAPTLDPANVLSLFSDEYTNLPVDTWRTEWSSATLEDIDLFGNPTKKYTDLDFVGIETTGENLVDASEMEYIHLDVWTPNMEVVRVRLVDFGADGAFDGGDDSEAEVIFENLPTQQWNSLQIPLSDFEELENRNNLAQYILSGVPVGSSTLYVDNVYFSKEGGNEQSTEPVNAAPAPGADEANVISVFSDSYSNIEGTNLNPDWGQATVTTEVLVDNKNTLKLAGLNYQGIELGSNQDVSGMGTLHIDIWTANSTAFSIFLISPGPVESSFAFSVPTSGWLSVDIPLSEFDSVDLSDIFQLKFEGDGDIWIDNIYFEQ